MKIRNIGVIGLVVLSGCYILVRCDKNKENQEIFNTSLDSLIENNKNNTMLDELFISNYKVVLEEEMPFKKGVEQLQRAYYGIEKIKEVKDLKDVDIIRDLKDKEKEVADKLTLHDIALLVEEYNDDETQIYRKNQILPVLNYINNNSKAWLKKYGLNMSKELLKELVSGKICNEMGRSFDTCKYTGFNDKTLFKYGIIDTPNGKIGVDYRAGILYKATKKINDIENKQKTNNLKYKDIEKDIKESIELVKLNIITKNKIKNGIVK